jgi:hypothetical protein
VFYHVIAYLNQQSKSRWLNLRIPNFTSRLSNIYSYLLYFITGSVKASSQNLIAFPVLFPLYPRKPVLGFIPLCPSTRNMDRGGQGSSTTYYLTWYLSPSGSPATSCSYITSPYGRFRVDSNTLTMGNPMPESTLIPLFWSRLYPPVRDFGFGHRAMEELTESVMLLTLTWQGWV